MSAAALAPSAQISCVIADDHPPVREFLSGYLSNAGLTVAASARDGEEALRTIRATQPDVALLDARMPQLSGLDVARELSAEDSPTRVVLYTGYGDRALLDEARDAGVAGLLEKDAPLEELVRALRVVAGGGVYIDPRLGALLIGGSGQPALTTRERDVLTLLADGLTNEQIGERLGISSQTVRTHVQKAMTRLDASTRVQAVATALRDSLIH